MKRIVQMSCVPVSLSFIALFLSLTSSAATPVQKPASEIPFLDALDDCIQQRFKDIDQSFGFRRIIRAGDTPHRFKPENAKELASLNELDKRKIDVALFLASRSVLGEKPDDIEWARDTSVTPMRSGRGYSRKMIKGPVWIRAKEKDDLPSPSELWEQSRNALVTLAAKDSYEFSHGNWKFIARPVRASEQSCLKCHLSDSAQIMAHNQIDESNKPLKIGDPLGVILYAYRESK